MPLLLVPGTHCPLRRKRCLNKKMNHGRSQGFYGCWQDLGTEEAKAFRTYMDTCSNLSTEEAKAFVDICLNFSVCVR